MSLETFRGGLTTDKKPHRNDENKEQKAHCNSCQSKCIRKQKKKLSDEYTIFKKMSKEIKYFSLGIKGYKEVF